MSALLFLALFKLYLWGAAPILFTALVATVPAYALNRRRPGQYVDAWLMIWAAELSVAALGFYIGGRDIALLESFIPPGSLSEDFGADSDFYFGWAKGTAVSAIAAGLVFWFRGRLPKLSDEDRQ